MENLMKIKLDSTYLKVMERKSKLLAERYDPDNQFLAIEDEIAGEIEATVSRRQQRIDALYLFFSNIF